MNNVPANETGSLTSGGSKWWKTAAQAGNKTSLPVQGAPCPKCLLGDLEFDTLFRLQCSTCGFIAECGAFT